MIVSELFIPEKHHEYAAKWWTAKGWPVLPLSQLSTTGIVVTKAEVPSAMVWLYKTDSSWCILGFFIADPNLAGEERNLVLSELISRSKIVAKEMGFDLVFATTGNESLGRRLKNQGFMPTEGKDAKVMSYAVKITGET